MTMRFAWLKTMQVKCAKVNISIIIFILFKSIFTTIYAIKQNLNLFPHIFPLQQQIREDIVEANFKNNISVSTNSLLSVGFKLK